MKEGRTPDLKLRKERCILLLRWATFAALVVATGLAGWVAGSGGGTVSTAVGQHINRARHHSAKHLDGKRSLFGGSKPATLGKQVQRQRRAQAGKKIKWPLLHEEAMLDSFCQSAFPGVPGKFRTPQQQPIRVYDGFILGDYGKELVHARLNELGPYVDYFIIVEDNKTFMRQPKADLAFGNHREEFKAFEDQIIYIFLGGEPLGEDVWHNEHVTREKILEGLRMPGKEAEPGDILITGDVDEVAKRRALLFLRYCGGVPDRILLRPDWYKYGFEYGVRGSWRNGPHAITYHGSDAAPPDLVQIRYDSWDDNFPRMESAGWHCSWCFARIREMINKVESWAHQEFNKDEWKQPADIVRRILQSHDMASVVGDNIQYDGLQKADVPAYVLQHPEHFQFLVNRTVSEVVGFEDFYDYFKDNVYEWPDVHRAAMSED